MVDSGSFIAVAFLSMAGVGLTSVAALKGWEGWLDVKRMELDLARSGRPPHSPNSSLARSENEVADLKERIRRLEAIASGIEP